jgi:hypothetical protein
MSCRKHPSSTDNVPLTRSAFAMEVLDLFNREKLFKPELMVPWFEKSWPFGPFRMVVLFPGLYVAPGWIVKFPATFRSYAAASKTPESCRIKSLLTSSGRAVIASLYELPG